MHIHSSQVRTWYRTFIWCCIECSCLSYILVHEQTKRYSRNYIMAPVNSIQPLCCKSSQSTGICILHSILLPLPSVLSVCQISKRWAVCDKRYRLRITSKFTDEWKEHWRPLWPSIGYDANVYHDQHEKCHFGAFILSCCMQSLHCLSITATHHLLLQHQHTLTLISQQQQQQQLQKQWTKLAIIIHNISTTP